MNLHIIKKNYILLLLSLTFAVLSSCETLDDTGGEEPEEETSQVKKVQFYADPAKFSRGPGLVITSIVIQNKSYLPKTFVDQCTESYVIYPTSGDDYFRYTVHLRNYNSLDAMMNGLEYSNESYSGIVYFRDLKNGCNTLEFQDGAGAQLYVLRLK